MRSPIHARRINLLQSVDDQLSSKVGLCSYRVQFDEHFPSLAKNRIENHRD